MTDTDSLQRYRAKRSFDVTREPRGKVGPRRRAQLSFVVQKHAARRLHYDFRLELGGVLKSWAIPKGPSLDPSVKRMAVEVEDHPLEYADFEGEIPEGEYGAGNVIVWDRGVWIPEGDAEAGLQKGKLDFELRGRKLSGRWALIRLRQRPGEERTSWLLVKRRDDAARAEDEYSVVDELPNSVKTNRPLPEKPTRRARAKSSAQRSTATRAAKKSTTATNASNRQPAPRDLPEGVRITHPERVIDAASGTTKADLMRYYAAAASRLLPHLRGRPVALVRAPQGVGAAMFFQKHARELRIPGIKQLDPNLDPEHEPLLEIASEEALLGAVHMNVIEFHTWGARATSIEKPDRIVFDLDPGEGVAWQRMREAAQQLRALLQEMQLEAFLKTSGGRGLHLLVPLQPRYEWDTVKAFAAAVTHQLAAVAPDRFAAKSGPKNRVGRIFVDYLRNMRGATTVAAWSVRGRPGLGISVPVAWEELASLRAGDHFSIRNIAERLERADPWASYADRRQSLRTALVKMKIDSRRTR